MRILGLDYGDKTVGLAICDELMLTAQPLETIFRERSSKLRRTYARIEEVIEEYGVERLVVGLPVGLDGQEGEMCLKAREFGQRLFNRTGLDVVYQDERMTSKEAENILLAGGVKKMEKKRYIDKMAASLILKTYLDTMEK